MDAKEFLLQYCKAARAKRYGIERKKAELEALLDVLSLAGVDYSKDRVQTSPTDKIATIIAKAVDFEESISEDIIELERGREEVMKVINRMPSEELKLILTLRYVVNQRWEDVGKAMNYSERALFRKKTEAFKELEAVLNEKLAAFGS